MRTPYPTLALVIGLFGFHGPLQGCGDGETTARDDIDVTEDASSADQTDGAGPTDLGDGASNHDVDALAEDTLHDGSSDASPSDSAEPPPEPGARGLYRVGHREETLTYDANDGSGPRSLRLVTWYPTEATTGDTVTYAGLIPASPDILGGAAPADLGPRPIVVFSHGNGSIAEQSFFFTEFLASHGYLVLAPDHTGNTFGDGVVIESFHRRPADVTAILDHLASLADADPLAPLVSDRIAVAGHSFGGYTTLAVGGGQWDIDLLLAFCASGTLPAGGCNALTTYESIYREGFLDPRVDALLPMTPGAVILFGAEGLTDIAPPTLLLTGALDQTTPNATDGDPAWLGLATSTDHLRVDFATAGHFTFSDACTLNLGVAITDGCGPGFLPSERAHRAINAYALAFLDLHLRDDRRGAALLSGELTIEPDVTLSFGR